MNLKYHRPRLSGHRLFVPQLQRKVQRLGMMSWDKPRPRGRGVSPHQPPRRLRRPQLWRRCMIYHPRASTRSPAIPYHTRTIPCHAILYSYHTRPCTIPYHTIPYPPRAHLSLFPSAGRVVASLRAQDPSLKLQAHLFKLLLTGYSIFYGSSIAFPCDRRAAIAIWHGTPSPPTPRLHTPTTTPPSPTPQPTPPCLWQTPHHPH